MSLYGSNLYRNAARPADAVARRAAPALSEAERTSILSDIGAAAGGTLSRVGNALSAPDDYIRGLLAGKPGERVTGWDLLQSLGVIDENPGWGGWGLGLATDILTSPSTYLLGPSQSLTKAGVIARKAGLLDNAATAATRKAIDIGLDATPLPGVAQRTRKQLEATGRTLSAFDPAVVGRPLYGPRTARRAASLDDLIKYADDPAAAREAAQRAAANAGIDFASVSSEKLGKSFGIGVPFGNPIAVGDPFGSKFGDAYSNALDTIGQGMRWSAPGRLIAAGFDRRVDGAIDAERQIVNTAKFASSQARRSQALREHTERLARVQLTHPEVFSEEGNRRLGRYLEGVPDAEDIKYVESRPALKDYADDWKIVREVYNEESMARGLPMGMSADRYGVEYLPRQADPAFELERYAGDLMSRKDYTVVPGGRDTLMRLSQDPFIAGKTRRAADDRTAAQYILKRVNALVGPDQPPIDFAQASDLAVLMSRLPDDAVRRAPLFGQHPTQMIRDYMANRAGKIGETDVVLDSLATMAVGASRSRAAGGQNISLFDALKRLELQSYTEDTMDDAFEVITSGGKRTVTPLRPEFGAKQQLRRRLSQLTGLPEDQIELSQFSIPKDHVDRLTRARETFSTDEATNALVRFLDHYTAAWRGSILAWPARAVRDLYSGAVQNWMAGANDFASIWAAKGLINEGANSPTFRKYLQSIPRYSDPDNGIAQFYADLASTELVQGGVASDIAGLSTGSRALDDLPGASPVNYRTILGELAPQSGRSWSQFGSDFVTWRSKLRPLQETRNPVLRASEQMNSLTDGVNRISGFLALMKQGLEPDAAARAIKAVQVDYSTLTSFERNVLKSIFPWYSFQSRIFRTVLKELVERPGGRYGQLVRAAEAVQQEGSEGEYVPSGLRSQFAFPLPEFLGGRPSKGTRKYLADLDLPGFDQINMIETPGTLSGAVSGTARQLAMQTHPLIRAGIEWASGQDLFNRRPLEESPTGTDVLLRNITGNPSAQVPARGLVRLLENAPFVARPMGLARQLTDTRGDRPLSSRLLNSAVNTTSGFKFRDVAEEDILADQTRQLLGSIEPYTSEFAMPFIPEDQLLNTPEYVIQRLAVARELQRQRRKMREEAGT